MTGANRLGFSSSPRVVHTEFRELHLNPTTVTDAGRGHLRMPAHLEELQIKAGRCTESGEVAFKKGLAAGSIAFYRPPWNATKSPCFFDIVIRQTAALALCVPPEVR